VLVPLTAALLVFRAAGSAFGPLVASGITGTLPWDALLDGSFVFQAFVGGTALALIDFVIARRAAVTRPAATAVQHVRPDER
jgi:hypothetical protein